MTKKNRKKKKKKFGSRLINLLLFLLLLIGLALVFNNQIKYLLMNWNANQYHTSKITKEDVKKNQKKKGNFDFSSVESLSTEAVLRAQMDAQKLPVIGGISMPDIGLNLPIFKGLSNHNLLLGAGTMKVDQQMGEGNYALASHFVTGQPRMLFSPLKEAPARAGQTVYLTDKTDIFVYVVTDVFIVTPEHVEVLDDTPNKRELTLVTCNDPGAIRRVIVRCDFKEKYPVEQAKNNVTKAFEQPYNQIKW
ncbi:MAG: class A sortase [Streptococcaceae bacterium]|jgi:sortase A|nr:class A sortase [Streptococcaceae bacterium]